MRRVPCLLMERHSRRQLGMGPFLRDILRGTSVLSSLLPGICRRAKCWWIWWGPRSAPMVKRRIHSPSSSTSRTRATPAATLPATPVSFRVSSTHAHPTYHFLFCSFFAILPLVLVVIKDFVFAWFLSSQLDAHATTFLRDRLIFLSLVFWLCNAVSSIRVCCAENATLSSNSCERGQWVLIPVLGTLINVLYLFIVGGF